MRQRTDVYRRRRLGALGVVAVAAALAGAVVGASGGDDPAGPAAAPASSARADAKPKPKPKPVQLPLGGRTIFPHYRVVAYYGAPQSHELGALGIGSPDAAGRRLGRPGEPVVEEKHTPTLAFLR